MAKMKPSVLMDSITGKAGNVVFSKTKEGVVIKTRTTPKNPKTPAQQAVRSALRTASTTFKNFTPTQVSAWNTYAATQTHKQKTTGKGYTSSGINAFTQLTTKFLQVNPSGTIPTTPPTAAFTGDSITITATSPSSQVLRFTASAANAAGVKTELLVQPLASAARKPQAKGYRSKGFFQFVSGTLTTNLTLNAGYYGVAYRFVNSATGQEVGLQQLGVVYVLPTASATGDNTTEINTSRTKKAA